MLLLLTMIDISVQLFVEEGLGNHHKMHSGSGFQGKQVRQVFSWVEQGR